jgi:formate hydrogenlyase transcriptional activator
MRAASVLGALVGNSPALHAILRLIPMVAVTDVPVLITGESGSGKELVARAIHGSSGRRERPLVAVNCAAVPKELFESEFFGHARGAFSGAMHERGGRFLAAHRGTLLLDEVTEFPTELQGKLLRVLDDGYVQRVGDDQERRVDVRLIAATNRDVEAELASGRFRADLYYRLGVFRLAVPPLRARRDDIPLLVAHFLQHVAPGSEDRVSLSNEGRRLLAEYDWPGNVRELFNVIERALILSEGSELRVDLALGQTDEPPRAGYPQPAQPQLELAINVFSQEEMDRLERDNIVAALLKTRWKIAGPRGAARLLGVKPSTLASRIKRLGLQPPREPGTSAHQRGTAS